jgi:hypothetical protein
LLRTSQSLNQRQVQREMRLQAQRRVVKIATLSFRKM